MQDLSALDCCWKIIKLKLRKLKSRIIIIIIMTCLCDTITADVSTIDSKLDDHCRTLQEFENEFFAVDLCSTCTKKQMIFDCSVNDDVMN